MECDACHQKKPTKAAVHNGLFGHFCSQCLQGAVRLQAPASAQYARDRDREDHAADLIQPWDANGNPNKEFIRMYPEESKDTFSQEELEKFA